MTVPTNFYRWNIVDEVTGKTSLTRWLMTAEDAATRYPGAVPDLRSLEIRNLPAGRHEQEFNSAWQRK
jgi:hypothetical protein